MSRIDVHTHFIPPEYRTACEKTGNAQPDGMPALPQWSPEMHLETMKQNGISKSILSISSPGTNLVGMASSEAADVARYCNDIAAGAKQRYPEQFGFWASLPLEPELAIAEIERATNIGADGFCFMTNSQGLYLGNNKFDKVFTELNRRKAIVFLHPTSPCVACAHEKDDNGGLAPGIKAAPLAESYANPVFEFMFDTARAIIHLFQSGTLANNPDITFIIPHLGGAVAPLIARFTGFSAVLPGMRSMTLDDVYRVFRERFFFDLAGLPFPHQFDALVKSSGVGFERLLYGSDYPFTPGPFAKKLAESLDENLKREFSQVEVESIYSGNMTKLLSRTKF